MSESRIEWGDRWLWYSDTSQPMHQASMAVIQGRMLAEDAALTFGVDAVKLKQFVPDHAEYLRWLDTYEEK